MHSFARTFLRLHERDAAGAMRDPSARALMHALLHISPHTPLFAARPRMPREAEEAARAKDVPPEEEEEEREAAPVLKRKGPSEVEEHAQEQHLPAVRPRKEARVDATHPAAEQASEGGSAVQYTYTLDELLEIREACAACAVAPDLPLALLRGTPNPSPVRAERSDRGHRSGERGRRGGNRHRSRQDRGWQQQRGHAAPRFALAGKVQDQGGKDTVESV
jgi:hypothetical protein